MTLDRVRTLSLALLAPALLVGAAGCSGGSGDAPAEAVVPTESGLVVVLDTPVSSGQLEAGSMVEATLARSVLVDGQPVIAAGTPASLEVVESRAAADGVPAVLTLQLASLDLPSGRTAVPTHPVEIVGRAGSDLAAETDTVSTTRVFESDPEAVVVVDAEDTAVELDAGQQLEFSTSGELRVPRG